MNADPDPDADLDADPEPWLDFSQVQILNENILNVIHYLHFPK